MQNYEQIVDRIYEAAAVPDLWPKLLQDIGSTVKAPGGLLGTRRTDDWMGIRYSPSFDTTTFEEYLQSGGPGRSITTQRLLANEWTGFLSDRELFGEEEYNLDPMMTEWAAPMGFYHGAATAIQMPTADFMVFQFMRRKGEEGFTRDALDCLDSFRPHLARAGMLAVRWRLERLRAATEALALVGLPAAILDLRGRALMANSLIQEMTSHIVWLPGNRIGFTDKAATAQLHQAIAAIGNPAAPSVRSFPAKHQPFGDSVIVHLVPVSGSARDLFDGGFGILVVTPISGPNPPDIALIQGLFDLTPAEAKVATGIVQGLTIDEMAGRYGTVRETVRTQVKAVLAKTGARRQVEVAARLSALPKIRG